MQLDLPHHSVLYQWKTSRICAASLKRTTEYLSFNTLGFCLAPNSQNALKHVSLFSIIFFPEHGIDIGSVRQRRRFGGSFGANCHGRGWPDPASAHEWKEEETKRRLYLTKSPSLLGKHTIMISSLRSLPQNYSLVWQQGPSSETREWRRPTQLLQSSHCYSGCGPSHLIWSRDQQQEISN